MELKPLKLCFGTPSIKEAPAAVMGRDEDVSVFWESVQEGSIRLLSERRMGKTWLLKLALARIPPWAAAVFVDAQGNRPAVADLVREINREMHRQIPDEDDWMKKVEDWSRRCLQHFEGRKLGSIEMPSLDHWSTFLSHTCERFVKRCGEEKKAVLIIDELPFFLDKIMKQGQEEEAPQLLDFLRELRHQFPTLRMVYCGSLGLHLVLDELRSHGYTNRPVNDMPPHELMPLAPKQGAYLAGCLLLGEGVRCSALEECAVEVALAASGVPFYIQHVVKWMKRHANRAPWSVEGVRAIVDEAAVEPGDPFELSYYDDRLDSYYQEELKDRARVALDVLSREPGGLSFDDLINRVRHNPKTLTVDPESMRQLLKTLRDDHYLLEEESRWHFRLEIVRRGWFRNRGEMGL